MDFEIWDIFLENINQNEIPKKNTHNFLNTYPFEFGPKPFNREDWWLRNGAG